MDNFWTLVIETWETGIKGFGISEIVVCIFIIVLSLILRSFLITRVVDWIRDKADKTENKLDNKIIESLRSPIGLVPIAFGFYLITFYLPLQGTWDFVATNLVIAVAVAVLVSLY